MRSLQKRVAALERNVATPRHPLSGHALAQMTDAELEEVERLFVDNECGELDELPPPARRRIEDIANDALARVAEQCSVKKPSNGKAWSVVGLNKR